LPEPHKKPKIFQAQFPIWPFGFWFNFFSVTFGKKYFDDRMIQEEKSLPRLKDCAQR